MDYRDITIDSLMVWFITSIMFTWYVVEGIAKSVLPSFYLDKKPLIRETVLITNAGM